MNRNFLPQRWLLSARKLLLEIESDGELERDYSDPERITELRVFRSDSLVIIRSYSLSLGSLSRLKSTDSTKAVASFSGSGAVDLDFFRARIKKIDALVARVKETDNQISPEELQESSLEGLIEITSMKISLTKEQKLELEKKLHAYADAFSNDQLYEPGKSIVSYENHKRAFVQCVVDLLRVQSLKNMLIEQRLFSTPGCHFLEMIFALEKDGFIKLIELGDHAVRSNIIASSSQYGKAYARVMVTDILTKYYREVISRRGVASSKPETREKIETSTVDKTLAEKTAPDQQMESQRSKDVIYLRNLQIDKKNGSIKKNDEAVSGKLEKKQLQLILALEHTSKEEPMMESALKKALNYKPRQKAALSTLLSKTKTAMGGANLIVREPNVAGGEANFYLDR